MRGRGVACAIVTFVRSTTLKPVIGRTVTPSTPTTATSGAARRRGPQPASTSRQRLAFGPSGSSALPAPISSGGGREAVWRACPLSRPTECHAQCGPLPRRPIQAGRVDRRSGARILAAPLNSGGGAGTRERRWSSQRWLSCRTRRSSFVTVVIFVVHDCLTSAARRARRRLGPAPPARCGPWRSDAPSSARAAVRSFRTDGS